MGGTSSSAPDALLGFLSVVTMGYTLLGALQSGWLAADFRVVTYLTVSQIPLVFVGLIFGAYYVAQQVRKWQRLQVRTT